MEINNNSPKLNPLETVTKKTDQTVFTVIRIKVSSGTQLSIYGYLIPTLIVGTKVRAEAL